MKTFVFVIEEVVNEDQDKIFIVRSPNGNVLGIFQSVGAAAECVDHLTDLAPANVQAAEK